MMEPCRIQLLKINVPLKISLPLFLPSLHSSSVTYLHTHLYTTLSYSLFLVSNSHAPTVFTQPALSGFTIHTSTLDTLAFGLVCRHHHLSCICCLYTIFLWLWPQKKKNEKKATKPDGLVIFKWLVGQETGVMLRYIIKHESIWWRCARNRCYVIKHEREHLVMLNRWTNKWKQAHFAAVVDEGAW